MYGERERVSLIQFGNFNVVPHSSTIYLTRPLSVHYSKICSPSRFSADISTCTPISEVDLSKCERPRHAWTTVFGTTSL